MTGYPPPPPRGSLSNGGRQRRGLGCLPTAVVAVAVLVLLVLSVGAVAGGRYLPLADDVRAVRETARDLSDRFDELEPADLDRATVDEIRADMGSLDGDLAPLRSAIDDPLVRLARLVPALATQLEAAESLIDAADALIEAGGIGLDVAEQLVSLREADAADADFELTAGLVDLVATSADDIDRLDALLATAEGHLDAIGPEAADQILEARDLVAGPLETYRPLLARYRELDQLVPEVMGWGGEKRYLVLAQNPAELRPAGGYAGTVGLITVRDGSIVEQRFQNVYDLDLQKGLPFVKPPPELTEYLLAPDEKGKPQSWRLADAAWSPDYPTGAQRSAEFYAIEAEGVEVDGVIAVTTYALDRLLEVVGPVEVPEYGVTVEPGDVTLTLLGATRGAPGDLEGRKDVLDALARTVMERLMALPPEQWAPMVEALEEIGRERMAMVWLADEEAQQALLDNGWAGPVRGDPGDYVYVVESNVAPTSKYNLVIDRADSLAVKLDEEGNARNSLRLDWQNRAGDKGELYDALRSFSESEIGWYGAYMRVLVPEGSELVTVAGEAFEPVYDVERIEDEAGRRSFANYLLMTPGESTLSYLWTVPGAAVPTADGWEYRLVVQKQPGARTVPLSVRVAVPKGASILEATEGAEVDGNRLRWETDLDTDFELFVRYTLAEGD